MANTEGPLPYGVSFRQCSECTADVKRQDSVLPVHVIKEYKDSELHATAL
jgi:hypothetical protein